jgi:hypothetical protein
MRLRYDATIVLKKHSMMMPATIPSFALFNSGHSTQWMLQRHYHVHMATNSQLIELFNPNPI